MLHKGEEVRTPNQISMGGQKIGPIIINDARDPKAVADSVIKAIKYGLRGELNDLLR